MNKNEATGILQNDVGYTYVMCIRYWRRLFTNRHEIVLKNACSNH